jgi:putative NAD(P)H nitroreductase
MDFEEVAKNRRSIRDYQSKPVSDEQLRKLFDMVRFAPSALNLQHWDFVIVKDLARRKLLRACTPNSQKQLEEAPVDIIVLGNSDITAHLEMVLDPVRKERVKGMATQPESSRRMWAQQNANLAAMTLMLAAQSMGLSTCPMTGFNADQVRKEFRIDDKYEIVMIIPLGYAVGAPPTPPKRSAESIMHFEKL